MTPSPSLVAIQLRLAAMWPLGKIVADLAPLSDPSAVANAVREALARPPEANRGR